MEKIKDFLNPESMITPGIAGGITMMISNALWVQFSIEPRYTGLIFSFIIGLAVVLSWKATTALWLKGIYWIVNSLIIFSVAIGGNYVGAGKASASTQEKQYSEKMEPIVKEKPSYSTKKLPSKEIPQVSREPGGGSAPGGGVSTSDEKGRSVPSSAEMTTEKLEKAKQEINQVQDQLEKTLGSQTKAAEVDRSFFKPW